MLFCITCSKVRNIPYNVISNWVKWIKRPRSPGLSDPKLYQILFIILIKIKKVSKYLKHWDFILCISQGRTSQQWIWLPISIVLVFSTLYNKYSFWIKCNIWYIDLTDNCMICINYRRNKKKKLIGAVVIIFCLSYVKLLGDWWTIWYRYIFRRKKNWTTAYMRIETNKTIAWSWFELKNIIEYCNFNAIKIFSRK